MFIFVKGWEKCSFIHYVQKHKVVQSFWGIVCQHVSKILKGILFDSAVPLLGMCCVCIAPVKPAHDDNAQRCFLQHSLLQ